MSSSSSSSSYTPPTNVTNLGSLGNLSGGSSRNTGSSFNNNARSNASSSLSTANRNLGSASGSLSNVSSQLSSGPRVNNLGSLATKYGTTSPLIGSSSLSRPSPISRPRPSSYTPFTPVSNTSRPASNTSKRPNGNTVNRSLAAINTANSLQKLRDPNISTLDKLKGAFGTGTPADIVASNLAQVPAGFNTFPSMFGGNTWTDPSLTNFNKASNNISSNPFNKGVGVIRGLANNQSPIFNAVDFVTNKNFGRKVAEKVNKIPGVPAITDYLNRADNREANRPVSFHQQQARAAPGTQQALAKGYDAATTRKEYALRFPGLNDNQVKSAEIYTQGRNKLNNYGQQLQAARTSYDTKLAKYRQAAKNNPGHPQLKGYRDQLMQENKNLQKGYTGYSNNKGQLQQIHGNMSRTGAIAQMNKDLEGEAGAANSRAAQEYRRQLVLNSAIDTGANTEQQQALQTVGSIADIAGAGGMGRNVSDVFNAVTNFPRDMERAADENTNLQNHQVKSPINSNNLFGNFGETFRQRATGLVNGSNPFHALGSAISTGTNLLPGEGAKNAGQWAKAPFTVAGNIIDEGVDRSFGKGMNLITGQRRMPTGTGETPGARASLQRFGGNLQRLLPFGQKLFGRSNAQSGTSGTPAVVRDMREKSIRDTFGENDTNAYLKNPESFRQAQATSAGQVPQSLKGAGARQGVMNEGEYVKSQTGGSTGMVPRMILDTTGRMQPRNAPASGAGDNRGLYNPDSYLGLSPADTMAMQGDLAYLGMSPRERRQAMANRQRAAGKTPDQFRLELEAERNVLRAGMKPNFTPKQQQMMMEVDALRRGIPQNATGMIPLNRREVYELERQLGPSIGQKILSGSNLDPATRQRNKQINRPTVGRRR